LVLISIVGWTALTHVLHGQERQSPKPNASGASTAELQKATQNPVASLISVPFQNNTDLNIGPFARDKSTLNVQPVIPMKLDENWNLIARIIAPLVFQPDVSQAHLGTFGLGDIQPTFFLSPAKPHTLIWGAGPALLLPTATDDNLGSGQWAAGPAVVGLLQPGKWTLGVLVSNLWSFAGSRTRSHANTMSLQYFVNYNLQNGWYVTSSPILSANWTATAGNIWLVPLGGGFGRIFKVGSQPVNGSVSAYYNVSRPDAMPSPTWQLRAQITVLYPRGPNATK
jgi:hypothetical protein